MFEWATEAVAAALAVVLVEEGEDADARSSRSERASATKAVSTNSGQNARTATGVPSRCVRLSRLRQNIYHARFRRGVDRGERHGEQPSRTRHVDHHAAPRKALRSSCLWCRRGPQCCCGRWWWGWRPKGSLVFRGHQVDGKAGAFDHRREVNVKHEAPVAVLPMVAEHIPPFCDPSVVDHNIDTAKRCSMLDK